jgi:hypothetical protein
MKQHRYGEVKSRSSTSKIKSRSRRSDLTSALTISLNARPRKRARCLARRVERLQATLREMQDLETDLPDLSEVS